MADNRLQQWMLPLGGRHELFRWLTRSSGRQEADHGSAESTVGEGEARSLIIW